MARRFLRQNIPLLSNNELPPFTLIDPMETIMELNEIVPADNNNVSTVPLEESTISENPSSPPTLLEIDNILEELESPSPSLPTSPKSIHSIINPSPANNDTVASGATSLITENVDVEFPPSPSNSTHSSHKSEQPIVEMEEEANDELFFGSRESTPSNLSMKSSHPHNIDNLEERYNENFACYDSFDSSSSLPSPPPSPISSTHTLVEEMDDEDGENPSPTSGPSSIENVEGLMDILVESPPPSSSPLSPAHSRPSTAHTVISMDDLSPSLIDDSGRPLSPEIPMRIRRRSLIGTRGESMDLPLEPPPTPPNTPEEEEEYPGWKELGELIPGVKQATQPGLPWYWRLFWVLMVVGYLVGFCVLISVGLAKAMSHSLIVMAETEEVSNARIPFPGVGFGTQSGFQGTFQSDIDDTISAIKRLEKLYDGQRMDSLTGPALGALVVFDQTCDADTTYGGQMGVQTNLTTKLATMPQAGNLKVIDDPTDTPTKDTGERIRSAMFNCHDLVGGCKWNGNITNCSEIFRTAFTDHGSTCVFNTIPDEATKRHVTLQTLLGFNYTVEELKAWEDVDADSDARVVSNLDAYQAAKRKRFPKHQNVPGQRRGLTFHLKQKVGNIGCIRTEGTGFRLSVNHPAEETQLLNFGKSLPIGHEVFIEILPVVTVADEDIKDIPANRRGCFFTSGDHNLTFYKKYTQQNCFSECISKRITKALNCSLVTLPGKEGRTLCNPEQMVKAREVIEELFQNGLDIECSECKPNCNDFSYRIQIVSTPIQPSRMAALKKEFNLTDDTEITIVNVFFGSRATRPDRRSSRYTWFEIVGFVGGIISLAGYSFIDVMDILVSIRKLERPRPKLRRWVIDLLRKTPQHNKDTLGGLNPGQRRITQPRTTLGNHEAVA